MIQFGIILCWILYSVLDGYRDAILFHNRNSARNPDQIEIHPILATQRAIVLIVILAFNKSFDGVILIFSLACMFPFFHDGQYYCTRNNLDKSVYAKRWSDDSWTSTAKLEFTFSGRIFLFVLSVAIIVIKNYYGA